MQVRFARARRASPEVSGVLRWEGGGEEWTALARCPTVELEHAVAAERGRIVGDREPSLEEVFVAHVGETAPAPGAAR